MANFTEKLVSEAFAFLNYKVSQRQRYPGGEGFVDLEGRARRFLFQLNRESAGSCVLVVSHAGSLRLLAMLIDPERRQEHLDRAYGNRFLGKVVLDANLDLVSLEVIQNPDRDLKSLKTTSHSLCRFHSRAELCDCRFQGIGGLQRLVPDLLDLSSPPSHSPLF